MKNNEKMGIALMLIPIFIIVITETKDPAILLSLIVWFFVGLAFLLA